jgi:hypothetical protein
VACGVLQHVAVKPPEAYDDMVAFYVQRMMSALPPPEEEEEQG